MRTQRAAIAAEVLPMFQAEARKRMATSGPGAYGGKTGVDQLTQGGSTSVTRARDEAAAMMSVSPASVRDFCVTQAL